MQRTELLLCKFSRNLIFGEGLFSFKMFHLKQITFCGAKNLEKMKLRLKMYSNLASKTARSSFKLY